MKRVSDIQTRTHTNTHEHARTECFSHTLTDSHTHKHTDLQSDSEILSHTRTHTCGRTPVGASSCSSRGPSQPGPSAPGSAGFCSRRSGSQLHFHPRWAPAVGPPGSDTALRQHVDSDNNRCRFSSCYLC